MRFQVTIEIGIDAEQCNAVGLTPHKLADTLIAREADAIDGIEIFPCSDKYEITEHFCLTDVNLLSVEMSGRDVGEIVTIRSDLVAGREYGIINFTNDMSRYVGRPATIRHLRSRNFAKLYSLDVDGERWAWTEEMFV